MAGVSEAFALGLSLGIDPKKLANIVNTSSGRHSALALCSSRRPHAHQYVSTVITHARHDGPQAWHLATTCSANNIRRWQVLELGHVQPMPWRDGKRACLARIHRRLRLRLDGEGRSRYTRGTRTRTHARTHNGARTRAIHVRTGAHVRVQTGGLGRNFGPSFTPPNDVPWPLTCTDCTPPADARADAPCLQFLILPAAMLSYVTVARYTLAWHWLRCRTSG